MTVTEALGGPRFPSTRI